ncbi:MAG: hypothetical protein JWL85_817 [Candidatus Saccharibacteria bacterium]|nr:hypothetical protein [Candidatus Saccharibacteria bacterium]
MKISKSLAVAGAVATIGLTSAVGIGVASAATSSSSSDSSSLVEKIASKFNLNKDDVQKVFDENKVAREAEQQQKVSDRLQKAVDAGKITATQKTLIENKSKELQTARDTERTELQKWADDNKIDAKYLMGGKHGGDSDRLQSLVDDKKITAEQKTLIEKKQAELETKRDAAQEALKKWADDNKIDETYLRGSGGHGHRGGNGGERF